jgi:DNA end-binding protein Ku
MAPRPFWKGYLKLSLVTCPVSMMPATTESERIRFHTLNSETGNRVQSSYVDAVTGESVDEEDEVKGYPRGDDEYVMLEDEELEAVALDSTRTIDIETFVARDSIAWIWQDKPHFLLPGAGVGEEAFAVIREAMRATKTAGIARLVLYRRERAVLLEPHDKGIVLWTLRYGDEVREPGGAFEAAEGETPDKESRGLVERLIEKRTRAWDPALVQDPVQDRLKEIIASKRKGRRRPATKPEPDAPKDGGNVISIMDALRRSLEAEPGGKPKRR